MTRTLRLATPIMQGEDVRRLQRLLSGANGWEDFHPGGVDGEYGPLTAAAVHRAKYRMGYARRNVDSRASTKLIGYLERGPKALPKLWAWRRGRRLSAEAKRAAFQHKVMAWARSQIGVHESPPGSNRNPYGKHWGEDGVPWCGLFVCRGWQVGGAKITRTLALLWDWVVQLHSDGRTRTRGVHLVPASMVAAADAVCLWADSHVELFDRWVDKGAGTFKTIGGNTSSADGGSQNNGGEVAPKVRHTHEVSAFVRKEL